MRQFEIVVCKNGSLEIVQRYIIEAKNVDNAREIGIARSQQSGLFVGAQSIKA